MIKNELIGQRIILRKLRLKDAQVMYESWATDPEVTKYMSWNPHQSIEETKNLLTHWIEEDELYSPIRYGIVLKSNNELVGTIDAIERGRGSDLVLGYCLTRKYWNQGLMTEAVKLLIAYLKRLGFNKLMVDAAVPNIGSNRVIKKCGGVFIKEEQRSYCNDTKTLVLNCYEINF